MRKARKAPEHVSTQGKLAREHVSTQGTLAREHASMQDTLASELFGSYKKRAYLINVINSQQSFF